MALLILIMVLGGAVHLWNSTHSLSLESRTRAFGLQQDFGLYREETDSLGRVFRWTGRSGGRMLTVEKPLVEIPMLASHPDIGARPVRVKISVTRDFFRHRDLLAEIEIRETSWKTSWAFPSTPAGPSRR